eukprot:COSAG01_NODE_294_length_19294_cov_35.559312_16_plen_92_part_00
MWPAPPPSEEDRAPIATAWDRVGATASVTPACGEDRPPTQLGVHTHAACTDLGAAQRSIVATDGLLNDDWHSHASQCDQLLISISAVTLAG